MKLSDAVFNMELHSASACPVSLLRKLPHNCLLPSSAEPNSLTFSPLWKQRWIMWQKKTKKKLIPVFFFLLPTLYIQTDSNFMDKQCQAVSAAAARQRHEKRHVLPRGVFSGAYRRTRSRSGDPAGRQLASFHPGNLPKFLCEDAETRKWQTLTGRHCWNTRPVSVPLR